MSEIKLYCGSLALFLPGEFEEGRRLLQQSIAANHEPTVSSWAVAIARENLSR